jgi:hypothetical protein
VIDHIWCFTFATCIYVIFRSSKTTIDNFFIWFFSFWVFRWFLLSWSWVILWLFFIWTPVLRDITWLRVSWIFRFLGLFIWWCLELRCSLVLDIKCNLLIRAVAWKPYLWYSFRFKVKNNLFIWSFGCEGRSTICTSTTLVLVHFLCLELMNNIPGKKRQKKVKERRR